MMTLRGRGSTDSDPVLERVMNAIGAGPAEDGRSRRKPGSRRSVAPRRRASQRLSELIRLAGLRRRRQVLVDFDKFAFALAATLGSASAGTYPISKAGRWATWPGLDFISLADAMRDAGFRGLELGTQDSDRLGWAMDDASEYVLTTQKSGLGTVLGRVVRLLAEERSACAIRTIDAIDETATERRERVRSRKLERDKERLRARRSGHHHRTRQEYEAGSAVRSRPWEAEGISRATYYRRIKSNSNASHEVATSATNLSHGVQHVVASPATDLSQRSDSQTSASETGLSLHPCNNIGEATDLSHRAEALANGCPDQRRAPAPPPPSSEQA